ncbi:MAG: alpha/beta fold hydrolase [Gemmatimonadaceae bacterium]|nr:alpha/beta fold hydrolase [Gemmatimonadaceae bacterium]
MSGRRFSHRASVAIDGGGVLADAPLAFHRDGALDARRANAVVVFHAFTGSSDAVGEWWREIVGPGRAIDTGRWAAIAPALLGSPYGDVAITDAHPRVTPRDQARAAWAIIDALGIDTVALAVGGSLGGMVALEFNALHPERVARTVVLAAPAAHTAKGIAWAHTQRAALALGGERGLAVARMIAMLTYRTEGELEVRFGRSRGAHESFAVTDWLEHHGRTLIARFPAAAYRLLLDAMDAHDLGRERGGLTAALRRLGGAVTAVGVVGDPLYPASVVRAWATTAGARYMEIASRFGHDAFLLETEAVSRLLRDALSDSVSHVAVRGVA